MIKRTINPLPKEQAQEKRLIKVLTLQLLQERGFTSGHPLYTELENLPTNDKNKNEYSLIIEWPDGITSRIFSAEQFTPDDIYPDQLFMAYQNSFYDGKREYGLG